MFAAVLSQSAQNALGLLGKNGVVVRGYLAGGSALALRFGHRISVDFDFFSLHEFDSLAMSHSLASIGVFKEETREKNTLLGVFEGVKYSYFYYPYAILGKDEIFQDVHIASVDDIAPMKLAAIMDRGKARDFVDLYVIAQRGMPMENVISLYDKKYNAWESNKVSILKSLSYFDDAEAGGMPETLIPLSWDDVKRFFAAEAVRLGKMYLEGKSTL